MNTSPKYLVVVQDSDHMECNFNRRGREPDLDDVAGIRMLPSHWWFIVRDGRSLKKELKRHELPGRTMFAYRIKLEPLE